MLRSPGTLTLRHANDLAQLDRHRAGQFSQAVDAGDDQGRTDRQFLGEHAQPRLRVARAAYRRNDQASQLAIGQIGRLQAEVKIDPACPCCRAAYSELLDRLLVEPADSACQVGERWRVDHGQQLLGHPCRLRRDLSFGLEPGVIGIDGEAADSGRHRVDAVSGQPQCLGTQRLTQCTESRITGDRCGT